MMINTVLFRKRNNISPSINVLLLWRSFCVHQSLPGFLCQKSQPNFTLLIPFLTFYIHRIRKSPSSFSYSTSSLFPTRLTGCLLGPSIHFSLPDYSHDEPCHPLSVSAFRPYAALLRLPIAFRILHQCLGLDSKAI